jgi:TonB family protein
MSWKLSVALYAALILAAASCVRAQDQPAPNPQGSAGQTPVYKIGNGVTPPRVLYNPDPEFSDQARRKHFQGTCVIGLVVGEDGMPRSIKIIKPLGMGLDEKAIETVRSWKFDPARKDGKPVAVEIAVEVDFHLYGKFDDQIAELTKKAAGDDAKAEMELSSIYLQGDGVPRDETIGLTYLEKAAKHGSPHAQFLMGKYTSEQKAPDYPQAYMWYTLAQRNGEKHSEKALRKLTAKMTPKQVQAGETLISKFAIPLAK